MITPVFDTFMGLLSAFASPLIFLSVAGSIYNIGDIATLGKVGKRMISRFLWMTLIFTTVFGIAILPLFPLAGSGSSSFRLSELLEMVLGIVPDNFFTPFLEGNPLQIIFLAVLAGMAMLILGNRAAIVSLFFRTGKCHYITNHGKYQRFCPRFHFGSLFNMILGKNFSVLLKAYKVPLVMLLGGCLSYGVKISPVWLITALIIAVVLAVDTPPIPGGALACYTILLLQLEIPAQAIMIAVAINVILDFFATAVDLFCLEEELVELAGILRC